MVALPPSMQKLIRELSKLPTIGEKSATRLAYFLIGNDRGVSRSLSEALVQAAATVKECRHCFFLTDRELCTVCENSARDRSVVCVIEKPMDLVAVERMGDYRGLYHVLHGLWAPLRGQGPESMRLKELLARVQGGEIKEVIFALSSTVEGDATALYIARLVNELGVRSSRLAQGLPKGGELEYADDVTLSRAMSGRQVLSF